MRIFRLLVVFVCLAAACVAQESSGPEDLAQLARELRETRAELASSQKRIEELSQNLEDLRKQVQSNPSSNDGPHLAEPTAATADQNIGFLAAKVAELHQDKVESAGKYPV